MKKKTKKILKSLVCLENRYLDLHQQNCKINNTVVHLHNHISVALAEIFEELKVIKEMVSKPKSKLKNKPSI